MTILLCTLKSSWDGLICLTYTSTTPPVTASNYVLACVRLSVRLFVRPCYYADRFQPNLMKPCKIIDH